MSHPGKVTTHLYISKGIFGNPLQIQFLEGFFMDENESLKQILMDIAFLENKISGIPLPSDDCSIDSLVLDCLNAYLFYLHGIAVNKGLL